MFPNIGAHHIAKFFQILFGKIPKVSITPLNIFVDSVQIQWKKIQKFILRSREAAN